MTKKSRSSFVTRHMDVLQLGSAIGFLLLVGLYASLTGANVLGLSSTAVWLLIISAVVGGYMAMNIGANDVANNMGPAVGSGAMTMGWAIVVAAIFEAMGAIVAGGDVVGTIKGGIIDSQQITDATLFAWVMFAALLAGALWLHLATAIGAPVSTTHSIIGAVMGAGIAAGGWGLVNWGTIGSIVVSWVVSPLMGGAIAAAFLYLIKRSITYRNEMTEAATRTVPWLIAVMACGSSSRGRISPTAEFQAGDSIAVFGGLILITHGSGWVSAYGHAERIDVTRGQAVKAGQVLGAAGQSGFAETPKLHFELRKDRKPVDPLLYLPKN